MLPANGPAEKGITKKGITEKGIKKTEEAVARKGWDGSVKDRGLVKSISRINCAGGICTVDTIVEVARTAYETVITGVMKTKQ